MSIPSAQEFLGIVGQTDASVPFAFGTIDPAYSLGNPKILFDGETIVSEKTYAFLSGYMPVANDRVFLARTSGSYVILGKFNGYQSADMVFDGNSDGDMVISFDGGGA